MMNQIEVMRSWLSGSFTKIVVGIDSEDALQDLILLAELRGIDVYPIVDLGKTEFNGVKTLTCAAFGPCDADILDQLTGSLKLL
jgi:peptidyl-tRNA hydrolase, PTH2 family